MKVLAILQARISSSRLPGKVLLPVLGEPMLFRQIERIRRAGRIDHLVVATSTDRSDDALVEACTARKIPCARGSLDDVLDRFVQCALPYQPDIVVRLTGDCPLADPRLIDAMLQAFAVGDYDYLSNASPPSFPDGLDVEVMRFSSLVVAYREAKLPSEREHVTPFFRAHPERFRLGNYTSEVDRSGLRWTVDEAQDMEFVRSVYELLYPAKPDFSTEDILELLESHPQLQSLNSNLERNAGFKKSLQDDARVLVRGK
jgi:spore coat polysaccharide biosynthesis protein SpsF (cytidylyltransferase family)